MDKFVACVIVTVVICITVLAVMAVQWKDCADDGKTFVRGAIWFECVAR